MFKIIPEVNGENSIFIYIPNVFSKDKLKTIKHWLDKKEYRRGVTSWNKEILREQLWYQMKHRYFCKDWKGRYSRWESNDYDNYLIELQNSIQTIINCLNLNYMRVAVPTINSCLINKYRDNSDSIKPHRDSLSSFGTNPTIVGLSVGSSRILQLKRIIYDDSNINEIKPDRSKQHLNLDIELENGSLFIMAGASQKYFSHEIKKTDHPCDTRYSLTFREHLN